MATLRWERSIAGILQGNPLLLVQGDQVYLVSQGSGSGISEVSIFGIDLERAELTLLFSGGTRSAVANHTGTFVLDEELILVNVGGRSLTAVDPGLANEVVEQD